MEVEEEGVVVEEEEVEEGVVEDEDEELKGRIHRCS